MVSLEPDVLLDAYTQGVFPMADQWGRIHWYSADPRGIIPLDDGFHIPKSLSQLMRSGSCRFELRINHDFETVMRACMEARSGETWINEDLINAYVRLHNQGNAHSVEIWKGDMLAGGLYGVSLGGAFFGESMFHRERNASKVALVCLVERLRERGFELLDSQASTEHLRKFGCIDIPAGEYMARLESAIGKRVSFV